MFEDTIGLPVLTDAHAAVLRCYLAVSDIAAYQLKGHWLNSENMVEPSRLWLAKNTYVATWLERITIGAEAHDIADGLVRSGLTESEATHPDRLFTAQLTVNFASPLVAKIWRKCTGSDVGQDTTNLCEPHTKDGT
jgi:hypothetical protein